MIIFSLSLYINQITGHFVQMIIFAAILDFFLFNNAIDKPPPISIQFVYFKRVDIHLLKIIKHMHVYNVGHFGLKIIARHGEVQEKYR